MANPSSCFRFLLLLSVLQLMAADHTLPVICSPDFTCPSVSPELASTFKVLVPNRTFFREFVDCSDSHDVKGFSVDVFKAATSVVQPDFPLKNVSFTCFNFHLGASYDDMVNCLSLGSFDAVVGDITISAKRLKNSSATLPYMNSGIVLLVPTVEQSMNFPWIVFKPFSAQMWCAMCASAFVTGFVLWILEHPEFRHNRKKLEIQKALWFVASVLFFFNRCNIRNPLARVVSTTWLGFVLILGAAYIAALTAILTVQKHPPGSLTMGDLQRGNFKVGYQKTSIVKDYLTRKLHIPDERLVGLSSRDAFANALSKEPSHSGGVAAIVDEAPYVNLFLSGLPPSASSYGIVGSKLTSNGFGFMFPIDSADLSTAFSRAILRLSENGELQKLQAGAKLSDWRCPTIVRSARLDLMTLTGLSFYFGLAMLGGIGVYLVKKAREYFDNHGKLLRRLSANRKNLQQNNHSPTYQ